MPVFVIHSTDFHDDGHKRRRIYIESYHPDLQALAGDLRGGPVVVRQIFVEPFGDNLKIIDGRDIMLTTVFIHHAMNPDKLVYEDVEA